MKENIILKWSLILAIVIVANLFFNYSLSLTLNSPDHDEFCPFEKTSKVIQDKTQCEASDGIWTSGPKIEERSATAVGYCDMYAKCQNRYQEALEIYEQKVFIALVIIGVVVLVLSVLLKSSLVLSSALALTAVLDLIVASVRYWRYSDELLKVVILFTALIVLVYLVVKKFKDRI